MGCRGGGSPWGLERALGDQGSDRPYGWGQALEDKYSEEKKAAGRPGDQVWEGARASGGTGTSSDATTEQG